MIKIQKAKISEAQTIRHLEERVWGKGVTSKYDAPMFVRFGYCYVAKDNNKMVGAIIAYPTKQGDVYVTDIIVAASYRRTNVGERLYQVLLQAVRQPIVSFIDPRNTASLALHRKLGAKVVRRVKDPFVLNEGYKVLVRFDQ